MLFVQRLARRPVICLIAACAMFTQASAQQDEKPPESSQLHVRVVSPASASGRVWLSLFKEDAFLKKPVRSLSAFTNDEGLASFSIKHLPEGKYALSAFLDENDDGELSTNFFGVPDEPFGFSNNARGSFGPPDFEQAAFLFPAGARHEIILMFVDE